MRKCCGGQRRDRQIAPQFPLLAAILDGNMELPCLKAPPPSFLLCISGARLALHWKRVNSQEIAWEQGKEGCGAELEREIRRGL